MKLELSEGHSNSNHSDFSEASQSSQESTSNDVPSSTEPAFQRSLLTNLEGFNSSAPTRTTATVTPTLLTNIEQTFIDLQYKTDPPNHAGFVPPPVATQANGFGIINPLMYEDVPLHIPLHVSPGPSSCGESSSSPGSQTTRRRTGGGRRPNKETNLTQEEAQKRLLRRERNKQAAARCRKRRLDHTNRLENETNELEIKRAALLKEFENLKRTIDHLEVSLENHKPNCRASIQDLKPFDIQDVVIKVENVDTKMELFDETEMDTRIMISDAPIAPARPMRPTSLNVPPPMRQPRAPQSNTLSEIAGVPISTPSRGVPLNFDSLMDGGTGLTPVKPCATQTRQDVPTPDQRNNKLVSL